MPLAPVLVSAPLDVTVSAALLPLNVTLWLPLFAPLRMMAEPSVTVKPLATLLVPLKVSAFPAPSPEMVTTTLPLIGRATVLLADWT